MPLTLQDKPSPVWQRTLLTDNGREGELKVQVTLYDFNEDGVKQQHNVQPNLQLPDVGLPQATDGQPKLRQLTCSVREERVLTVPDVVGVSPEPPDDGGVPHESPDGGAVSLQQPGVPPKPPGARGVTDYRPDLPDDGLQQLPVGRPRPLPPECQPELPQLTDHVREERDRAQLHCSAQQVPHDAYNGNGTKLNIQDHDQVPLMYKSSLDILILASLTYTYPIIISMYHFRSSNRCT